MTKILLRKQLAEKPHRRIILAFCKRLSHVKHDRLGNVMRDGINIRFGHSVAFCVGCYLVYLGNKAVHKLAAYVYQPLHGV